MAKELDVIAKLAGKFSHLPGVGKKTALRYAYSVIDMSTEDVDTFCEALKEVKEQVKFCSRCGAFTDKEVCDICLRRDSDLICVVAYPKDVLTIEKALSFKGVYHVLGGTLSPMDGRGVNDLKIKELLARVGDDTEVILATNPDVEGEATAMYLARLLKPLGVKVSRIAQGISLGSDIEYADEATLLRAIEGRITL